MKIPKIWKLLKNSWISRVTGYGSNDYEWKSKVISGWIDWSKEKPWRYIMDTYKIQSVTNIEYPKNVFKNESNLVFFAWMSSIDVIASVQKTYCGLSNQICENPSQKKWFSHANSLAPLKMKSTSETDRETDRPVTEWWPVCRSKYPLYWVELAWTEFHAHFSAWCIPP